MSARSKGVGVWVRILPELWMSVSCECCMLLARGLCDGPITRPQESYRVWCVKWVIAKPRTDWTRPGIGSKRHGGKNSIRCTFVKEDNGQLVRVVNRTGTVFVTALQSHSLNVFSPF